MVQTSVEQTTQLFIYNSHHQFANKSYNYKSDPINSIKDVLFNKIGTFIQVIMYDDNQCHINQVIKNKRAKKLTLMRKNWDCIDANHNIKIAKVFKSVHDLSDLNQFWVTTTGELWQARCDGSMIKSIPKSIKTHFISQTY